MKSDPTTELVTPGARKSYRLLSRIIECTMCLQEANPGTVRLKLRALRAVLSLLNGIGRRTFKGWTDYQQRFPENISESGLAYRSIYQIQNICKDLNEVPPEYVDRISGRLQIVLSTLNAIGRSEWKEWKDYNGEF